MCVSLPSILLAFFAIFNGIEARPRTGAAGLLDAYFSSYVLHNLSCQPRPKHELQALYKEGITIILKKELELFRTFSGELKERFNEQKRAILSGEFEQQAKMWAEKVCASALEGHKVSIHFDPDFLLPETFSEGSDEELPSVTDDVLSGNINDSRLSGFKLELSGVTLTAFVFGLLVGAIIAQQAVKVLNSQQVSQTRLRRPEL